MIGGLGFLLLISCAAPSPSAGNESSPLDTVEITGAEPRQMLPVSGRMLENSPDQILMELVEITNSDTIGLSVQTSLVNGEGATVDLGTVAPFPSTAPGTFRLPFGAKLAGLAEATDAPLADQDLAFRFELIPLNQPELFNENVSVRLRVGDEA